MHKLSLKSLVQLELVAFTLVLLAFPWTFLFHLTPRNHALFQPWLRVQQLLLLSAPAVLGYLCDWRLRRKIRLGLSEEVWNQAQIDAAYKYLSHPATLIFRLGGVLSYSVLTGYVIFSSLLAANQHTFVLYLIAIVTFRFMSLRRLLAPPSGSRVQPLWSNLAPIHSGHWGQP